MSDTPRDGLLDYYYAELDALRTAGGEFARDHPAVAARLELGAHESPDPHVERLIESFAYLTARLQRTLEVEVPGISSGLLEVLHPQYLNPVPPMTVAQLEVDPAQGRLSSGYVVPRDTPLLAHTDGQVCRFRTCAPLVLQPVEVVEAALEPRELHPWAVRISGAAHLLRVRLRGVGVALAQTRPERLRFYLAGEMSTATALYDLLVGSLMGVVLLPDGKVPEGRPPMLPASSVQPAGFADDEALLPAPPTAHPAYRLLQEYFTVPRKFLFLDVEGLQDHGAAEFLDLVFVLNQRPRDRLEVHADDIRLGCVPVANLFARLTEPVRVDQRRAEYRLVADGRRERSTEIHSVLGVQAAPEADGRVVFEPFHSFTHRMDPGQRTFWHARRAPAERADLEGTDVFLSFLDLRAGRAVPPAQTVWAQVLCTNRRLAEQLLPGPLQLESAAPVRAVRALHPPTRAVDPPLGGQTQWRLVSHLSLNHLSLSGDQAGRHALREILRLYAAWGDPTVEAQVQGIRRMECRPAVQRAAPEAWRGFWRGTEVDLTLDENACAGTSALLLASVLDRFLALYAAVNSFTRLSVRRQNREGTWKTWPARVGRRPLL